jgi:hypothetical protein
MDHAGPLSSNCLLTSCRIAHKLAQFSRGSLSAAIGSFSGIVHPSYFVNYCQESMYNNIHIRADGFSTSLSMSPTPKTCRLSTTNSMEMDTYARSRYHIQYQVQHSGECICRARSLHDPQVLHELDIEKSTEASLFNCLIQIILVPGT